MYADHALCHFSEGLLKNGFRRRYSTSCVAVARGSHEQWKMQLALASVLLDGGRREQRRKNRAKRVNERQRERGRHFATFTGGKKQNGSKTKRKKPKSGILVTSESDRFMWVCRQMSSTSDRSLMTCLHIAIVRLHSCSSFCNCYFLSNHKPQPLVENKKQDVNITVGCF